MFVASNQRTFAKTSTIIESTCQSLKPQIHKPVAGFKPFSFKNAMMPSMLLLVPFIFQFPPTNNFLWSAMVRILFVFQLKNRQI